VAMRECVIFDLDGTFAFLGDRSPYDASKAEGDEINAAVHFVYEAIRRGKPETAIFLVSGREDRWRAETERWGRWVKMAKIRPLDLKPREIISGRSRIRAYWHSSVLWLWRNCLTQRTLSADKPSSFRPGPFSRSGCRMSLS